jgi:hypothetical protein
VDDNMTKEGILELVRSEYAALEETLGRLEPEEYAIPGADGEWSVTDTLGHLASWRRLLNRWMLESLEGRTPDRPAPGESWDDIDAFNHSLYLANRDRTPEEALAELAAAHAETLALIESISESDLIDPDRFAWRRGDPIWHMVAGNTWWHDQEHNQSISRWLETMRAA